VAYKDWIQEPETNKRVGKTPGLATNMILLIASLCAIALACGAPSHAALEPTGRTGTALSGTIGVWQQMTLPSLASGQRCQSIVTDPVNQCVAVIACGQNLSTVKEQWYRTTNCGDSWTLQNGTTIAGNPWGFTGDMNPSRDPATAQTLFAPAGYGSFGGWISTDNAVTWTRNTALDTALHAYNPSGATDLYETAIIPDANDSALHLFVTYHYAFKGVSDGGFAESCVGGS
jgi:hypothetical protein